MLLTQAGGENMPHSPIHARKKSKGGASLPSHRPKGQFTAKRFAPSLPRAPSPVPRNIRDGVWAGVRKHDEGMRVIRSEDHGTPAGKDL